MVEQGERDQVGVLLYKPEIYTHARNRIGRGLPQAQDDDGNIHTALPRSYHLRQIRSVSLIIEPCGPGEPGVGWCGGAALVGWRYSRPEGVAGGWAQNIVPADHTRT